MQPGSWPAATLKGVKDALEKTLASGGPGGSLASPHSMSELPPSTNRTGGADPRTAEEILPLVYEELRRVAARKMATEAQGHTLQTTALVHEAWLQLAGNEPSKWSSRSSFLAAAADVMRHILIDRARRKARQRHSRNRAHVDLNHVEVASRTDEETLLKVDEVLTRFAQEDPMKAELVKLRFFVGLNIPEAAAALGISEIAAKRWWAYARAWLYEELKSAN